MATQPRLLIIGYGYGGSQLTAALAKHKKFKITVITALNYQEVPFRMTRSLAGGRSEYSVGKGVFELVKEPGVEYVESRCTSLTASEAQTESGQTIPFDACVVVTGSRSNFFFPDPEKEGNLETRIANVYAFHDRVAAAKSIVICGGGPIGVETAADIKMRFTDKKVTLVDSHDTVLSSMSEQFRPIAMAELRRIGVDLVLGDRVVGEAEGRVELKSGKVIDCEVYIAAFAETPNTAFMPSQTLDGKGFIKVNKKFHVEGYDNVFSFSSCSNISSGKSAAQLGDQLPVVTENIVHFLTGRASSERAYVPGMLGVAGPLLVGLGHGLKDSFGLGPDLPGFCLPGLCWLCCCLGTKPCSPPAGKGVGNFKSDFNESFKPVEGKGMSR